MIPQDELCALRDGSQCLLRCPGAQDAPAMIAYLRQLSQDTDFMTRCPDEAAVGREEEEAFLEAARQDPRAGMLCAFADGQLAGCCSFSAVGLRRKLLHRAQLGIGVLRPFWGRGIGTLLLGRICAAAGAAGCEQIELEVVDANMRAQRLYEKNGFSVYGRRPHGFRLDGGGYYDELLMIKML
ncbi:MAG: GNAT family N-acetyltransferase [Oscillospiraceae bacterium]|nr:GNAT family N-acetyltransferase [Oscillospiraceae bacterium]